MPELDTVTRDLFDRPLAEQLRTQAEGERLGAMTWTALAERESDARRKAVLLECAQLEIASAETLERLLAAGLATGGSPVIPTMRFGRRRAPRSTVSGAIAALAATCARSAAAVPATTSRPR
jgi:hypothetical protein